MLTWLATTRLGHAALGLIACVVMGASMFGYGWTRGDAHGKAAGAAKVTALQLQIAAANLQAQAAARASENSQAAELAAAANIYERGKSDAQADSAAVIAGLRAGRLKLRDDWTDAPVVRVPTPAATGPGVDAAERRREQSAGRIIGATKQCVAQVAALQRVIRGYLSAINGGPKKPDKKQ